MMIKKWVCFVIILITGFCGYTGMAIAKNYPDVPTIHPYCQAVDFVTDYDMIPKVHEKEFKPDDPVVRGEAAQFLCRTVNFARADRSNSFADITADDIFGQEAGRLAQNDILDDSELFLFRPYDTITYGEALRWMIHAAGYRQEAMDAGGYPMGYLAVGQDQNFLRRIDISDSEQWMTRGDMAQLLYNFCVRTGQGGIGGNDVGGIMSRDTVWKKENGPYIIRQPLTVAAGVRLKAEAGTEIILLDDMIVNGCLQAMGDTNDRIKISV